MSVLCRAALRQPATISGRRLSNLRACGGRSFLRRTFSGKSGGDPAGGSSTGSSSTSSSTSSSSSSSSFTAASLPSSSSSSSVLVSSPQSRFWAWTTQTRPSWRESKLEAAVIFCVFGVTGSTSVAVVRPCLKNTVGLEGNMVDGPWSYRILSLLAVSPIYACFLLGFGTLSGRHTYFAAMALKIFGRFVPKSIAARLKPKVCQ